MKTTSAFLQTTGTVREIGELARARPGIIIPGEIVPLAEGALATWQLQSPRTFHVLRGTVWLTCEHRTEDFLLQKGESLRLESAGKVIAQSLIGSATLELHE